MPMGAGGTTNPVKCLDLEQTLGMLIIAPMRPYFGINKHLSWRIHRGKTCNSALRFAEDIFLPRCCGVLTHLAACVQTEALTSPLLAVRFCRAPAQASRVASFLL